MRGSLAGARGQRGIALVSVIAVLVLLAMVATPFLLTMRDSAARGEKFLYGEKADAEAEALFNEVRSQLVSGLEHVERKKLDSLGATFDVNGKRPPADATPDYDTPEELAFPKDVLERFNQSTAKEHRVWAAEISDAQTLFNLNTCSYPILANILGRAEVRLAATGDQTSITLDHVPDTDCFGKSGGVVRIGSECIRYKEIRGNELSGCERGYLASAAGNGPAHDLQPGDVVVAEAAFQLATRPYRVRTMKNGDSAWVHYVDSDQSRTISDLGVAALSPADFERLRPYVTAWNGNAVGDGWCNPQLVHNAISATSGSTTLYAKMKNVRYFGPGTIVRITDGVHDDYAVVTKRRGKEEVLLAGKILHDYVADQTRIYGLARSPINVNTADVSTLALVFSGLKLQTKNAINERQAQDLAFFLKQWKPKPVAGQTASATPAPPGVFRDWDDLTRCLEDARDAGKLDQDGFEAVLKNAMNANDADLAYSTVPFVFRCYDIYEVRARVSLQGAAGRELARREIRRVMEISTTKSGTYVLETQEEFENQIIKSRDAKYMTTYPTNVQGIYDGVNIPPSEYRPFSQKNLFPSTDRTLGIAYTQSAPGSWRFTGGENRVDHVVHFDDQKTPDGYDIKDAAYTQAVDDPYEPEKGHLGLIDKADMEDVGSEVEFGIREFALSFWYRPDWDRDSSEHVIFDYGNDNDHLNRVSLRYDPHRDALVLACADGTREQHSAEIVYRFAESLGTWKSKEWYHLACHVHGCRSDMMELFVDGDIAGKPSTTTRLKSTIPATGNTTSLNEISVEANGARDFPDQGCLLVRGRDGMELLEYSSKSDDTFTITRRKARTLTHNGADQVQRQHDTGDSVSLYGFTAPLYSDARKGGGTLGGQLGPWRPYRMWMATSDQDKATVAFSGNPAPPSQTLVGLANPANTGSKNPTITLQDWDTGSTDTQVVQDIGQAGTEGIAMIIAPRHIITNVSTITIASGSVNANQGDPQSVEFGGIEFVDYVVGSNGTVQIQASKRNLKLAHISVVPASDNRNRFMPMYSFGDPANNTWVGNAAGGDQDATHTGVPTAFIPIAILVRGGSSGYLNPQDKEPQLKFEGGIPSFMNNVARTMSYIQIDGEWIGYDTFDTVNQLTTSGQYAFYNDLTIPDLCNFNQNGVFPFFNTTAGPSGYQPDIQVYAIAATSSGGQKGGAGNSGNEAPATVKDKNDDNDTTGKGVDAQASGAAASQPAPVINSLQIAQKLNFRGYENKTRNWEFRVANSIPRSHTSGTAVIPAFCVTCGNNLEVVPPIPTQSGVTQYVNDGAVYACPGYNDLITLRDVNGNDEQIRVQWGFFDRTTSRGWCAPAAALQHDWYWDRPQNLGNKPLNRWDARAFTRAIKFPSGELPDVQLTKAKQDVNFGKKYDGSGGAQGTIDEILWRSDFKRAPKDRPDYAYLGEVPAQLTTATSAGTSTVVKIAYAGIDEKAEDFKVHMPFLQGGILVPSGLPIDANVYQDGGGILLIDDEMILYEQFDSGSGHFQNCLRGAFGTLPKSHSYESLVIPIRAFPASRVTGAVDTSSGSYPLADASDFPDDGYIRIGNANEIIGYTNWTKTELSAPLGRFDPNDSTQRDPKKSEKRAAGSIFRGRYGTVPETSNTGDVAIGFPFRYYDRYAENADDPEQSYLQLSWTKHGAVWKRVSWDAEPKKNVEVVALIRFSGGPPWDCDTKKVIHVGQDAMPSDDRRQYLYQITDPKAMNLINVEADRIEVRFGMRYDKGAYDRLNTTQTPDYWKETPSIRKVSVEFVAPPQVLEQE